MYNFYYIYYINWKKYWSWTITKTLTKKAFCTGGSVWGNSSISNSHTVRFCLWGAFALGPQLLKEMNCTSLFTVKNHVNDSWSMTLSKTWNTWEVALLDFFLFLCLTWWEEEQQLVVIDSDICSVPCYRLRQWRRGGSNTRQRHNKWGSGSGTDSREGVISPPAHFTVQLSVEPREASARTSPPFCSSACRQNLENTGI